MAPQQLHFFGVKVNKESKNQKEGIIIPVDTTIFIVVVIILLFVISFSWGVERGRKLALEDFSIKQKTQAKIEKIKLASYQESEKNPGTGLIEDVARENTDPANQENINKDASKDKTEKALYKIQVASFRTSSSAHEEAKRLEKRGFPVIIDQKGRHSVVYVGGFADEKKAKEAFDKLKTTYNDCILRKLN